MNKSINLKACWAFLFLLSLSVGCEKKHIEHKGEKEISFNLDLRPNSGFSIVTRAQSSDSLFKIPEADAFKIQLLNASGTVIKEWESYSEMPHPIKIQANKLQIKASCGFPEKSNFDAPCFSGDTTVFLQEDAENNIMLTAGVGHVLASVRYRENFSHYFKDFSAQLITSADTITFGKEEKRTAFLPAGKLDVLLNMTRSDLTTSSLLAVSIPETKAAEYYRFHVSIGGEQGYEKLLISFDSTTAEQPIEIALPQDWQAHKKPYLTPAFDTSSVHKYLVGESCDEKTFYTLVTALGKIGSCRIKTASASLIAAGWPANVDLLSLTSANRSRLLRFGLKWSDNMEGVNMAELDFSGIVTNLPAGKHTITVDVTDVSGQHSVPLNLKFHITPPLFELVAPERPAIARSQEYPFKIRISGGAPENIIIEYLNENLAFGVKEWTKCNINSWKWNATQDTVYVYAGVNINKPMLQFRAKYGDETTNEVTLSAVNPTFRLQKDGLEWAKRAYLNIEQTDGTNGLAQNTLIEQYDVQISTDKTKWNHVNTEDFSFDKTHDLVKFQVNKLEGNHTYYVRVAFDAKADLGLCYSEPIEIKTEAEVDLPEIRFNRDKKTNVQKGGRYGKKVLWEDWANYEYVDVFYYENESSPWENVNLKTIPRSASKKNSWYMVASTLPKDNGVLLRNVGWDNNGTEVPEDKSKRSLSELPAPAIGQYSSGKLFLGPNESTSNYSYDHSDYRKETYLEGYPFTSRPLKLSFSYTYKEVVNNDKAFVKIEILDANNHTIGTGEATFENQEYLTKTSVTINYTDTQTKAAKLKIMFASSSSCSYDQSKEKANIEKFTTDKNADAVRTGSEFFITNVTRDYE